MNKQNNFSELYKSAFDNISASDELVRKVKSMTETKPKKKIYAIRKVLYVAAAIVILLVASNVITYAATGETWAEMVLVNLTIDGEKTEVPMKHTVTDDGEEIYEYSFDDKDSGHSIVISAEGDVDLNDLNDYDIAVNTQGYDVVEEDGKTYILCLENDFRLDITEDIKDGKAEGTFENNGEKLGYTVEETSEGMYSITLNSDTAE